jgi:hypothetical protein
MKKHSENQPEKWNLNYFSPSGEKFSGSLIITESAVIFRQKQNNSKSAISLNIDKDEINAVAVKKSMIITEFSISANGKNHIFTRTILNPREIINKLKTLIKN